jgi:hypothetical protein
LQERHPVIGGDHWFFVFWPPYNSNNDVVKEVRGALNDVDMTERDGVVTPRTNCNAFSHAVSIR